MGKLRIGFVGVGGMGQCAHLKNYAVLPDCEVVAISEPRPKLAAAVAARYGVPKVYGHYKDMLAAEKLDGIVASQPFTRHGTMLPEVLKAKVPVFCEKPIAGSIEMGEKVAAAVKQNGSFLMVGYHKRSDPATMYAKKEIDRLKASGEMGKMKYIRILMPAGEWVQGGFNDLIRCDDPPVPDTPDPAPADMDKDTFNTYISFVNYYIHQVNLMRHLLGEPYAVTYAEPTGVLFVGKSQSGLPCTIEMTPYQTSVDWQESALVAFERGYVKIELPAPLASNRAGRVEILRDGKPPTTTVPHLPWVHSMRQQALNFLAAVKGEAPPLCTADEALEDLKVAREYIRLHKGK